MLTRRKLLGKLLRGTATLAIPSGLKTFAEGAVPLPLKFGYGPPVEVPANFTGLGYEMSSVATPDLLSPSNNRYVELVRGLGPQGVLRVGGIVANYTRYIPDGPARFERQDTVITTGAIERFAAFLNKVGWTTIWSVNFAQGSIDSAVTEARVVSQVLGSRLLALEIGNEVDSYGRGQPFRQANYDYDAYRKEYDEWRAAITKAIPNLPFAAPDTARTGNWVDRMAKDERSEVQLLTTHYYRNGQARGSAEQLLTPDPRLNDALPLLQNASKQSGIPWRMCEINSFSGGGRPGVSDTFVGTLWTLNTMLLLAQAGCAGVNMETGVNQLGFVSSYSPIQDDGKGLNSAGAPYYGMLAFAQAFAGCDQLLPLAAGGESDSMHAYALGAKRKARSVVVINMDLGKEARISLAGVGMRHATLLRLTAPAADSKAGVMLGGSQVDESGRWKAARVEPIRNGNFIVPPMSAAVASEARR